MEKELSEYSTIRRIIPKHPQKGYQNEWGALLVQQAEVQAALDEEQRYKDQERKAKFK
jgi:hypothetical protein